MTDVPHFISDCNYLSTRYKEKADTFLQRFRRLKPRQRKAVLVLLSMDDESA